MFAKLWVLLLPFTFLIASARAEPVAICEEVGGLLFDVKTPDKFYAVGQKVEAGTSLVALFKSKLKSANGAVHVGMLGDIGTHSDLPVMESAVRFGTHAGADLAVTLERGIVILSNAKKSGSARVQLTIRGQATTVDLLEPSSVLAVEVYGRHAPGPLALKNDDPTLFVVMLALSGESALVHQEHKHRLKSPPGPAILHWDSVSKEIEVGTLDKLPLGLRESLAWKKALIGLNLSALKLKVEPAQKLLEAPFKLDRLVSVTAMGARDDLDGLTHAISVSADELVRNHAILVLRSWLGREPGQLAKFEAFLTATKKVPVGRARTVANLLIGWDDHQLKEPTTYEFLIDLLESPQLAARSLALWHLSRLAPAGKDIAYDPAGTPESRAAAIGRWRQLIPAGKLPPAPKGK